MLKISTEQVRQVLARKVYLEFFKEFWQVIEPQPISLNWHIPYICDELQKVTEPLFTRSPKKYDLVINIPPGMTKSSMATVFLHPWLWANDPSLRVISSSYSQRLSTYHSMKSKDVINSEKYQKWFNVPIRFDQSGKEEYANLSRGERVSTSTGGSITGKHADLIIIDDPINPKQASSDIERENANEYIRQTLNSRKTNKEVSVTIIIMQRLHVEDVTGMFLELGNNVKHICLPGELADNVRPKEVAKYYINGLLDKDRLTPVTLQEMKNSLGSYGYAGQIQQQPAPDSGGIWKSEWFKEYIEAPKDLEMLGSDWDLAYTKNDKNSASAYVTAGRKGHDIYIVDFGWDWLEFPELIQFMSNKQSPHYVEGKASGKSAVQTLKKSGILAIESKVDFGADKIARARMATPIAEAGHIYVPKDMLDLLTNDSKQGLKFFPNGAGDDLVDALSQCILRLAHKGKPEIIVL